MNASLAAETLGLQTYPPPPQTTEFAYGYPTPVFDADSCFSMQSFPPPPPMMSGAAPQAPRMQHTVSAPPVFSASHMGATMYDMQSLMYSDDIQSRQ